MTTEAAHTRLSTHRMRGVVVLVGILGCIYSISQFLRNSVGVIAPNLASELDLSASQIGFLASAFFFAFAGAQIPLGIALDRYGPRRCMLFCAAVAVAGALIFAAAPSPGWLIAARILMGLGSSCYLMAPLALYARQFSPDRFATLVGFQIGLGSLGTLLATAPFAFAVAVLGWRASFVIIAAAMVVATLAIVLIVPKDDGSEADRSAESLRDSFAGTRDAIRTPSFWPVFLLQLTGYSSFVLVVGLWGGPYLTHVYGYSLTERGNMLLVAVVAQVIGSFLWGPSDRLFNSYKIPVLAGSLLTAGLMALAAIVGAFSPTGLLLWFIALGGMTAYLTVLIAHGKSLFPPKLVGRGLTLFNMATMGGVFLTQAATGLIIDLFPQVDGGYSVDAYRTVFAVQAICILLGSLAYLRSRDPRKQL
ncbi:MFS transporter [Pseudorhodoplanes sinuspersici]|nr:MFS transporter [Pseudorhodoplanes sinuspersici]RKE67321.1 putative MFS family arabinose efflux permease [Pseudorhodoplanes sinuspersici]